MVLDGCFASLGTVVDFVLLRRCIVERFFSPISPNGMLLCSLKREGVINSSYMLKLSAKNKHLNQSNSSVIPASHLLI